MGLFEHAAFVDYLRAKLAESVDLYFERLNAQPIGEALPPSKIEADRLAIMEAIRVKDIAIAELYAFWMRAYSLATVMDDLGKKEYASMTGSFILGQREAIETMNGWTTQFLKLEMQLSKAYGKTAGG